MRVHGKFQTAIDAVSQQLEQQSYEVRGARWQSIDVAQKPEMRMREVLNVSFQVNTRGVMSPTTHAIDIKPNMPWAEEHFLERVNGEPLNPGVQWRNWPWSNHADKFRIEEGGKFSHTYMERYWPKLAGTPGYRPDTGDLPHHGIRYNYGDLNDVVSHLLKDPLSRQAYLPVWFPEDTGVVHGERVPCTLGYHFIVRNGYLHTTYYIRSCDFVRHFRDDLYLSVRLAIWLLSQLRGLEVPVDPEMQPQDAYWQQIQLGLFTFHCVSLHCFVNDWNKLFGKKTTKGS